MQSSLVTTPLEPSQVAPPVITPTTALSSFSSYLWTKIASLANACLTYCDCCGPEEKLIYPHEMQLLRSEPQKKNPETSLVDRKVELLSSPSIPSRSNQEPDFQKFDTSLQQFRALLRSFMSLLVTTVHKNQLSEQIVKMQGNATSLPPLIKSAASLLTEMGDRASKPLFQKFARQKAQVIDPSLQKIFKMLVKGEPSEISELRRSLEQKIAHELKELKPPSGQDLTSNYIRPILDWLIMSDRSVPLTDQFSRRNCSEVIIDKVFETAVSFLLDRKIDQCTQNLAKTLEQRLNLLIKKTMKINAKRLVDFFSYRLSELLTSMPYTETFDALFSNVIDPHICAILSAEKMMDTHRELLEKANDVVKRAHHSRAEFRIKLKAQEHLKTVSKHGGEQPFLEHMFLEEFGNQPGCSPEMKQIIRQQINLIVQQTDPSQARQASEKAAFVAIADNILGLFLAPRKKLDRNNMLVDVDPFVELWNLIYLPKEVNELFRQLEEFGNEFITPDAAALVTRVQQPSLDMFKSMFKALVQDTFKKYLVRMIQTIFETLTQPNNLNELFAESIFPLINESLLEQLIAQEIGLNISKSTPRFYHLIKDGAPLRELNLKRLRDHLIKNSKAQLQQLSEKKFFISETFNEGSILSYSDFTDSHWMTIANRIIEYTEKEILKLAKKIPYSITSKDVSKALYKLQEYGPLNLPIFGKIAMNLLFKIGEQPYEKIAGYFIKDTLSLSLSNAVSDMRATPYDLMTKLTNSLKLQLLDKKYVENLFSDDVKIPKYTNEKLVHQVDICSRICHDLIIQASEQRNFLIKFAAQHLINNESTEINKLITKIYQKLFSNPTLNFNLLHKLLHEIVNGLNKFKVGAR